MSPGNRTAPIIENVTLREANAALEGRHYLGPLLFRPRFRLAERDDIGLEIIALAAYSSPVASHFTRLYIYPMALTVAQVVEKIGGPGRHYQAIKPPPSPLD